MRRLTRAEAQQQTREDILAAAEALFLGKGYVATTVAQVADAAGRTQGAIYANFSGKEDLCVRILERHGAEIAQRITNDLAAAGPEPEERLSVLLATWRALAGDAALTTLVAEYVLATRHDAEQRAQLIGQLRVVVAMISAGLDDQLHIAASRERVERAAKAVTTTVAGLAFGQATGLLTADETTDILEDTLRTWLLSLELKSSDGTSGQY